jgi:leucyl-tRNA synthetase
VSEAELETQEKKGRDTGLKAIHPLTGEELPVWVANFVLMGYGTGAVMAVPGPRPARLRVRAQVFAADKAGDHLAHAVAAAPGARDQLRRVPRGRNWYATRRTRPAMLVNSGEMDGMTTARRSTSSPTRWRRRARQAPRQLPPARLGRQPPALLGLPDPDDPLRRLRRGAGARRPVAGRAARGRRRPSRGGTQSPIKSDPEWRKTTCPSCGGPAERETDTFDTFMESSWYYARYTSPGASDLVDERADYWLPVDQYIGGIEHAIMHLMYFRFYHKLMRDAGLVQSDEPARNLLCQGMVIADTFYRENADGSREWYNPADVTWCWTSAAA